MGEHFLSPQDVQADVDPATGTITGLRAGGVPTPINVGGGAAVSADALLPATAYVNAGSLTAPLLGARSHMTPILYPKKKRISLFDLKANTAVPASGLYTDVAGNPLTGPTALQISRVVGGLGAFFTGAANSSLTPIDVTNGIISITFRPISDFANLTTFGIQIFSTSDPVTPGAAYHQLNFIFQGFEHYGEGGSWATWSASIEEFSAVGGGADLRNIRMAAVQMTNTAAVNGNPALIQMGAIDFMPRTLKRGVVILGFDDCRQDTWDNVLPKMARYGFPGVLYPGAFGFVLGQLTQLTQAQIIQLQDAHDWQVAGQAMTTENPGAMTDAAFEATFSQRANMMAGLGLYDSGDGSWFSSVDPQNQQNRTVSLRKFFRSMRIYRNFALAAGDPPMTCGETMPPGDPFLLRCFGVNTAANSAAQLIGVARQAADTKGIAIIVWHNLSAADAPFDALMTYLDANRDILEVCTMTRAVEMNNRSVLADSLDKVGTANYIATPISPHVFGVIARESGDEKSHTTVLDINATLPAIAGGASLGVGRLLYTFPPGAVLVESVSMSVGITQTQANINANTPRVGLGTVVASGAVAVLSGTPTFENILAGQLAANCTGTPTVKTAIPTANVPFVIESADVHTIFLNAAAAWAASGDAGAQITGKITINWKMMS